MERLVSLRDQRLASGAAHRLPLRRHAAALDHDGARAADAAGRAGGRDPAAGRRQDRRRRHHRRARHALHAGAARADRHATSPPCCRTSRTRDVSPMPPRIDPPLALLAELTHRCPLRCPYCSNPVDARAARRRVDRSGMAPRAARGGGAGRPAGAFLRRRADGAARACGADRRRERSRPLQQSHHVRHAGRRTRDRGLRRRRPEARPAQLPGFRAGE